MSLQGTKAWFFQAVAPINWTILPNTGDCLLAVSDGTKTYSGQNGGVSNAGSWQQTDTSLSIAQLPPHNHTLLISPDSGGGGSTLRSGGASSTTLNTGSTGSGQGHNHGSTWRPQANVGIICNKST